MRLFVMVLVVVSMLVAKVVNVQVEGKIVDPVYMLPVDKYPKFQAKIVLRNGDEILFCCPKAMFDLYIRPFNYPEFRIKSEQDFKGLYVKDYLSGKWIDAKKALYIFGSRLQGPKGDDLIPLRNKDVARIYRLKYGGSRILTFGEILHKGYGLIKFLDMP